MESQLLTDLLKAGGISALSIGVMYLLYRAILQLEIIPKLKQWQGFILLCLVAVFVFTVVLVTLLRSEGHSALIPGELPADNHFQMDAYAGLFCESKNVRDPFVTFFDEVEVYFDKCANGMQGASRAYRVEWIPESPTSVSSETRHNYNHCFVSDFSARAPVIADGIDKSVNEHRDLFPCEHHANVFRGIRINYNNIRNESQRAAFVQSFIGRSLM